VLYGIRGKIKEIKCRPAWVSLNKSVVRPRQFMQVDEQVGRRERENEKCSS
jgi:hypothetical protein